MRVDEFDSLSGLTFYCQSFSRFPPRRLRRRSQFIPHTQQAFHKVLTCRPASVLASDDVFTWDDVIRISKPETHPDDSSDLRGYSEKIKICNCTFLDKLCNTFSQLPNRNRPIGRLSEFLRFVIEDQIVGYIHKGFAENLPPENSNSNGGSITLHSSLRTGRERWEMSSKA